MRAILSIVALAVIALGLWLIASSFTDSAPAPAAPAASAAPAAPAPVLAAPRQNASPVILGTALLAGGVVFFILILRRK